MIRGNWAGWAIAVIVGVLAFTESQAQEVVSCQADHDPAHVAKREADFTPWCTPQESGDYWQKLSPDHLPIFGENQGDKRRTLYLPNPGTGYWTLDGLTKQQLLDIQKNHLKIHDELVNIIAYRDSAGNVTGYWALWVPQSRSFLIKEALAERGITAGYLDYGFADRVRRSFHRLDPYTAVVALAALGGSLAVLAWLLANLFSSWRKARGIKPNGSLAAIGLLFLLLGNLRAEELTLSKVDTAHAEAREAAFIPWGQQPESSDYWNRLHMANIPILNEKTQGGWMRDIYVPWGKWGYWVLGGMPKRVLFAEDKGRHLAHYDLVSAALFQNEAGQDLYWALWAPHARVAQVQEKMAELGITTGRIDYNAGDRFEMWAESVNPQADRIALIALGIALLDGILFVAIHRMAKRS